MIKYRVRVIVFQAVLPKALIFGVVSEGKAVQAWLLQKY